MVEGDWEEDLTVVQVGCGRPRGVYSRVCCERRGSTGPRILWGGGILADRIAEVIRGADSYTGPPGFLETAMV